MNVWEEKLVSQLVGLARATEGNEHLITDSVTQIIAEILRTNVQSEAQYNQFSAKIEVAKREMVPDCFLCANPCGRTAALDMKTLEKETLQVRQAKITILQKLQTIAASARNPEQDSKLYLGLIILGLEGYSPKELTALFSE